MKLKKNKEIFKVFLHFFYKHSNLKGVMILLWLSWLLRTRLWGLGHNIEPQMFAPSQNRTQYSIPQKLIHNVCSILIAQCFTLPKILYTSLFVPSDNTVSLKAHSVPKYGSMFAPSRYITQCFVHPKMELNACPNPKCSLMFPPSQNGKLNACSIKKCNSMFAPSQKYP
jgi:hypothetical protein